MPTKSREQPHLDRQAKGQPYSHSPNQLGQRAIVVPSQTHKRHLGHFLNEGFPGETGSFRTQTVEGQTPDVAGKLHQLLLSLLPGSQPPTHCEPGTPPSLVNN